MAKSKPVDAIALLKADHRKVEELFSSYEAAKNSAKKLKIAHQICDELNVHTRIEEEVFYPAVDGKIDEDLVDEAYVEHDGAKALINELLKGTPDSDEFYDAKVSVLSEQIKHHVKEEEQRGGMFSQAKKADVDLDALGAEMAARKKDFMAQAKANSLPHPTPTTMTA